MDNILLALSIEFKNVYLQCEQRPFLPLLALCLINNCGNTLLQQYQVNFTAFWVLEEEITVGAADILNSFQRMPPHRDI